MHKVKELKVWHKGMEIVEDLYALVQMFPTEEKFGLKSQMVLPTNLETQLILSKKLGFAAENDINQILQKIEELQKMNYALINKLK